jgi:hypothetical protein
MLFEGRRAGGRMPGRGASYVSGSHGFPELRCHALVKGAQYSFEVPPSSADRGGARSVSQAKHIWLVDAILEQESLKGCHSG